MWTFWRRCGAHRTRMDGASMCRNWQRMPNRCRCAFLGHGASFPTLLLDGCYDDLATNDQGTFGTNKAVNIMASCNGPASSAGAWPDPDLLFSYGPVGGNNQQRCLGAGKLAYCTGSFCDPVVNHSVTQFGKGNAGHNLRRVAVNCFCWHRFVGCHGCSPPAVV